MSETQAQAPVSAAAAPLAGDHKLSQKDFVSDQEVRWCPGCGDYSILAQVQRTLATLDIPREKFVFVSGIGCSARFPYYMNTYGFHTIHGRAPAVATGLKVTRPDLEVWVVTGDGDGLSIGAGHLLHAMRRNVNIKILLVNNRIYGLTKGQYSPTSEMGKKTKSSPYGTVETPVNPICVALASEVTFIARTVDSDPKHMIQTLTRAAKHKGTAFVEILQNCIIFNDKAFAGVTARETKDDRMLFMEHGQPLLFGPGKSKGIRMTAEIQPEIVELKSKGKPPNLWVHDEKMWRSAPSYLLARMKYPEWPMPFGVFRAVEKPTFDDGLQNQLKEAQEKFHGEPDLAKLLAGPETWEVQ